jgi:DNA-binding NtrC family response regulator
MGRQPSILLVDDDSQVREALGEALVDENYDVTLAANSQEAVHQLQETKRIDAVVLDLSIGTEGGWTLLSHLTTIQPALPVILMTGGRGEALPGSVRKCVALMEKPLDIRRLFATLRSVTATQPSSDLVSNPSVTAEKCSVLSAASLRVDAPQPELSRSSPPNLSN